MAVSEADLLPENCLVNGFLAVKAERIANHTQVWHVRVDVPGRGVVSLSDWSYLSWLPVGEFPELLFSEWEKRKIKLNIAENRDPDPPNWTWLQFTRSVKVASSPVSETWLMKASADGFYGEIEVTEWSGQDAIDIEGFVVWSDPDRPEWRLPMVYIALESGYYDTSRTPPHDGEPISTYLSSKNGFVSWDDHRVKLLGTSMVHGVAIPFRAVMVPDVDDEDPVLTMADRAFRAYRGEREGINAAAKFWPLVATTLWPNGEWLAFGEVPRVEAGELSIPSEVMGYLESPGHIYDRRRWAHDLDHGAAGNKPVFGLTKGSRALAGDAWHVLDLMHSSEDYWLRSAHHYLKDGTALTMTARPGVETWAHTIESRASADNFGKLPQLPPGLLNGRKVLADDQHLGTNFLITSAALGDRLSMRCLRNLARDQKMRAKFRRVNPDGTPQYDAPRTSGRLGLNWAHMIQLTLGSERDEYIAMALQELDICERVRETMGPGPVRPLATYRDDRVMVGQEAWMGWQEGTACLLPYAMYRSLMRIGDTVNAEKFLHFGISLARCVVEYATALNTQENRWVLIDAVKVNPGGEPHDASYYRYPRDGATSGSDHTGDMHIPDSNWWPWSSCALKLAKMGPANDPITLRAEQIFLAEASNAVTLEQREWWAF